MLKRFARCIAVLVSLLVTPWALASVEINTADQAQLDSIAGIGPATSRAILEERKKNGNFKDWADLEQRVRGIGERNSVKLSAAGLVVNGQQRSTLTPQDKSAQPMKVSKTSKEVKDANKDEKNSPQSGEAAKTGEAKR